MAVNVGGETFCGNRWLIFYLIFLRPILELAVCVCVRACVCVCVRVSHLFRVRSQKLPWQDEMPIILEFWKERWPTYAYFCAEIRHFYLETISHFSQASQIFRDVVMVIISCFQLCLGLYDLFKRLLGAIKDHTFPELHPITCEHV